MDLQQLYETVVREQEYLEDLEQSALDLDEIDAIINKEIENE